MRLLRRNGRYGAIPAPLPLEDINAMDHSAVPGRLTQRRARRVTILCALALALAALTFGAACAGEDATAEEDAATKDAAPDVREGVASYYSYELAGNPTSSGEPFDPEAMTAAHRTLPMGTRLRVTNLRNDRSVVVRINDRGPYAERRILDVSRRAAERLGMLKRGKVRVRIEVLE